MDAAGWNNTSSEWEFISCHIFSFHLEASRDVSAEASPIFHSPCFHFCTAPSFNQPVSQSAWSYQSR